MYLHDETRRTALSPKRAEQGLFGIGMTSSPAWDRFRGGYRRGPVGMRKETRHAMAD